VDKSGDTSDFLGGRQVEVKRDFLAKKKTPGIERGKK